MIFKRSKIILAIGVVLAIAICVFQFFKSDTLKWSYVKVFTTITVAVSVPIVFFGLIAGYVDNRQLQKITNIAFKDCRPDIAIPLFKKLMPRGMTLQNWLTLKLSYASVLCLYGQWEEAQKILAEKPKFSKSVLGVSQYFSYYACLLECGCMQGNFALAEDCLQKMQQKLTWVSGRPLLDSTYYYLYYLITLESSHILSAALGQFDTIEHVVRFTLLNSKTQAGLVHGNYTLGLIYSKTERMQQAVDAFNCAAGLGGTTWYATAARQALAKIQTQMEEAI